MHTIQINDLRVSCLLGRTGDEKDIEQQIGCTVIIQYDAHAATASDDWPAPIDYKDVARDCEQVLRKGGFAMIETAAERLAKALSATYDAAVVKVRIEKPQALRKAASAIAEYEVLG